MKNKIILIIIFIISVLFVGAATATANNNNIPTHHTNLSIIPLTSPSNSIKSGNLTSVSNTVKNHVINSGANKFYWGQRGGIFSYNWIAYQTSNGSILVLVHYKTTTNSWYGQYLFTQASKNKLKILDISPEVLLYSGHPSITSFANTSLTPVQYYWKKVRNQINSGGYFFV